MKENVAVFDFELDAADMATLDGMTTPEAIAKFVELYRKCVVRDTPLPPELAKEEIPSFGSSGKRWTRTATAP